MTLYALDFESEAIQPRPNFPPRPVGLAVYKEGNPEGAYTAWGHPSENDVADSMPTRNWLSGVFHDKSNEFVFHNAAFDCSIIEELWCIHVPWERVHDTMLMAFLVDPYGELGLKPLAERYLGEAPVEQSAVRDWLVDHGVERAGTKNWGRSIARAPGGLVGWYAKGDVRKTLLLYRYFEKIMKERGLI